MRNHAPLWQPKPEEAASSEMQAFLQFINNRYRKNLPDYFALHQWSVTYPADFWQAIWSFMQIIAHHPPQQIFIPGKRMQDAAWFTGATLNFAENLLRYRDDKPALIFHSECGENQSFTYQELYQQVKALVAWLRSVGVVAGDRIVGFLPNCPATVIAMLATTALGAIWSACSSDFGPQALLDRFSQIEPKILFAADGHIYGGKIFYHLEDIRLLQQQLPSLQQSIIVPLINPQPNLESLAKTTYLWDTCIQDSLESLQFNALPFSHPLYILYSSGTTGKPKCIVHGAGGTLLQHLKELRLHTGLTRQDTIFFYTTCAWMMWHWLISSLAVGATIVLYEGNPYYPHDAALYNLIDRYQITIFGVGAKAIEIAENRKLHPAQSHSLASLKTILTTGSPLLPESFDFVYQKIKSNLRLSSISGGSDIISCFALGNPLLPVYRGELQCLGLGMNVKIFNEQGQAVHNTQGELVCTTPFPCMPVYFWNDPQGEKYQQAYFERFPGVWAHGDYAQLTEHGSLIIYGRSDATLKPAGVRIGTGEIYQQVKKFPEISDCLAVGHSFHGDEKIILFVTLSENKILTSELIASIKTTIRKNLSPHHVPAKIIQAPDLPRTVNGKLMEIVVKKIINHQPFIQSETLVNPHALDFFKDFVKTIEKDPNLGN